MSHSVNVNTDSNQVIVQITTTDNTIQVQQDTSNDVVQVNAIGPQGPKGEVGPSGSVGPVGPPGTITTNSGLSVSGSLIVSGSDAVADFSQTVAVTASSLLVQGDILPDINEVYDIGASDKRFKDLYLSGSTIYLGDTKLTTDGGALQVLDSASNEPLPSDLSGSFTGSYSGSVVSTDFTFSGDVLNVLGDVFVQGTLDAATKNFKIQHPTMEGYYLVHSSLEGPERGIYHRGKLKTSSTIHLPDYWEDLPVDDTDITVQLTPIGNACQHFVKSVTRKEIEVGCDCGQPHCFYIVHAQRYNEGKFEVLEPKRDKSL